MKKNILFAVLLLFLVMSCGKKAEPESSVSKAEVEKVNKIAMPIAKKLLMTLKGELQGGMQSGGPMAAIEVCNKKAMELTAQVEKEAGGMIEVKRVSEKPRNPKNSPDKVDEKAFAKFNKIIREGKELPQSLVLKEDGVYYFYKPLKIQAVCLNCHGDKNAMDKALVEKIKQLYPNDKATGYKGGDLRGVVRIKVKEEL